ncbi:hypothetical protein ASPZODRAFT_141323 [Penicilliopsis zonata CBS 506.65]|uniref:Exocyst complex component Sec3 PIP2-binding N-terminal domain-containing protein n=1 Tax=Penicilliopsis zonata CBS 506.65 TaxID=1073090 RepID=A0A1L9SKZ3_9EURO|nr:hypothetical protein ASPZODRAFT_141323 [Penicilliopsis zonata CBS 506.65]OJJ47754.1 hypothetical protein ASPZODRAFT_141323 [Penicilliopsis zonata CBS 506.65]
MAFVCVQFPPSSLSCGAAWCTAHCLLDNRSERGSAGNLVTPVLIALLQVLFTDLTCLLVVESYITHVRITEDGAHPSTPPPPDSPPENKKARVIVVAVRRSGRVRMHKARENSDGSFSIGKTWMLDDLSAIQSYSALVASNPTEQQHKQWASNMGFVVTVGKPYYWHAATSKEKDFFIGSLVKIYIKYTGGKVPNLIGFDEREKQMIFESGPQDPLVPPGSRAAPPTHPSSDVAAPPRPPSAQANRPQSPYSNRAPSRDGPRSLRRQASEDPMLRAQRSRDQMRPPPGPAAKVPLPPLVPNQPGLPEQPPPRATERLAATDNRMPRGSDSRAKDLPAGVPPGAGPISKSRVYGDSDEHSVASSQTEGRQLSSRDGKGMPELRPVRSHDSGASSPELRRNKDGLRPATPASSTGENRYAAHSPAGSLGQRSIQNESTDRTSTPESRTQHAPLKVNTSTLPPSLRPGSAASNRPPPSPRAEKADPIATPVSAHSEPAIATPVVSTPQESKPKEPALPEPETVISPASPPEVPSGEAADEDAEAHRPGLGPMIKKKSAKDVAGAFRKAATAYGAFRPRVGGAGERLLAAAKQAKTDEPDGITSVVPAPSLRPGTESARDAGLETPDQEAPSPSPAVAAAAAATAAATAPITTYTQKEPPTVEVTADDGTTALVEIVKPSTDATIESMKEAARSVSPASVERRRRRREDNTAKYLQALGIDPSLLEGRGVEFDDILTDLGWNGRLNDEKRIEDLEADVRREIGRVEATSWLGNVEQQEGKVDQLAQLIDKTIEECEELDGLLTLYSHELNTLHDDVAYIEAQSQGLQVQTANQKLLQNELQNLLKTLSISSTDLQPLREASLSNPDGLNDTETSLSILYKAMLMIDSDIWQNKKRMGDVAGDHGSVGVYADTEVGQMRAIKEKKEEYRNHARQFLQRLHQYMKIAFKMAESKMIEFSKTMTTAKDPMKLDNESRDYFRQELWMYHTLMLFAREVSTSEWNGLISLYESQAKIPYQNEFRDNSLVWKRAARTPVIEESELLFTHQEKEKETDGLTMAARKLTVRRGKTVRANAGLRLSLGDKKGGKIDPYEAFSGALQENLKMISDEQNFLVQFFHLSSLANADFPDLVASAHPDERRRPDFSAKQLNDPDREMAMKLEQVMDEIYNFWPTDLQNMVDWATKTDPLQGIGILFALERAISENEDTNQEFIIHALQKLHTRLVGLFNRFVDEQIRGIEETKVKVNKRKGVISFMRVFPNFLVAVENMLSHPAAATCEVRNSVNEAYNRINRAMWESLKFIAKEAPGQAAGGSVMMTTGSAGGAAAAAAAAAGDPEDKEVLNYHILLIENMNHYLEEVEVRDSRQLPVLERWLQRAQQDLDEHLKLYLDAVIHRPLGKLLDFVESTEALLEMTPGPPTTVAARASHSRSLAKKVLAAHDSKELRRGIELLKKRVEKHFGDADDPGLSRSLVLKVLRQCEARYEAAHERTQRICETVYEGTLELEWRVEDAQAVFQHR